MDQKELEERIDEMYALRQEIREWNAVVREMQDQAAFLEEETTSAMADLGLSRAGTEKVTISLSSSIVPSVDPAHWNDIRAWAIENDFQELLPRSLNQTSYRELLEIGIEIPHVQPFEKQKMSVRKAG